MALQTQLLRLGAIGLAGALMAASPAQAITLNFDETAISSNDPATGASAIVEMSFSDLGGGLIGVTTDVLNTTGSIVFGSGADESTLTGFGFDLLGGLSFLESSSTAGSTLDTFVTDANFDPFGTLDLGIADNGNFLGGQPDGLFTGMSDLVTFVLDAGTNFANAAELEAAMLAAFMDGSIQAGIRFQEVNAGAGSDKLLLNYTVVPLPAGLLLLLTGLAGIVVIGRRNKMPVPA